MHAPTVRPPSPSVRALDVGSRAPCAYARASVPPRVRPHLAPFEAAGASAGGEERGRAEGGAAGRRGGDHATQECPSVADGGIVPSGAHVSRNWVRHLLKVGSTPTRGYEGKNEFVYRKWASHFWLPVPNFIFPGGKLFWGLGWAGPKRGHLPPPPPPSLSAQISATTKRGCRPWAGSPWGPGNRRADLLLPLTPPPTEMGRDQKQTRHPPPSMPSHPHCRPAHGD